MTKEAELVIAIFDSSEELTKEDMEILDLIKDKKTIIVLNKSDLPSKTNENDVRFKKASESIINISALNKKGIEGLYDEISKLFNLNEINLDHEIVITNLRHKNLINKANENVKKAKEALKQKMPLDIIAIFIKDILEDLGTITGEIATDDIIDEIFSKFCLGK